MRWLCRVLSERGTPRWILVLGWVVAVGIPIWVSYDIFEAEVGQRNVLEEQKRIDFQVREFQRHSVEFQTYAAAFVSAILDESAEVGVRREQVIDNILEQYATINVFVGELDEVAVLAMENYRSRLKEMKIAVESAHDVLSLSGFWAAASDLLVARNEMLDKLAPRYTQANS